MANELNNLLQMYGVSPSSNTSYAYNPTAQQLVQKYQPLDFSGMQALKNSQNANVSNLINANPINSLLNTGSVANIAGNSGIQNVANNFQNNINAIPKGALNIISGNAQGNLQNVSQNQTPYSQPNAPVNLGNYLTTPIIQQIAQQPSPFDFGSTKAPTVSGGVTTYGTNKLTGADIVNLVNSSGNATATNANSILNQLNSTGLTNQQLADMAGIDVKTLNTNMANLNKTGSQTYGPSKMTGQNIITYIQNSPNRTNAYDLINQQDVMNSWGLTAQQLADLTGSSVSNIQNWMNSVNSSAEKAKAALSSYH